MSSAAEIRPPRATAPATTGVIALAAAAKLVRESRAPRKPRLDPLGLLLLSGALVLLLYPLVEGSRRAGRPGPT